MAIAQEQPQKEGLVSSDCALLSAPYSGLSPSLRVACVLTPFILAFPEDTLTREAPAYLSPFVPLNSSPCSPGSSRGTSDSPPTEKSCLGKRGPPKTNADSQTSPLWGASRKCSFTCQRSHSIPGLGLSYRHRMMGGCLISPPGCVW